MFHQKKSIMPYIFGDVLPWRDTYFNICRPSLTKKDVKQSQNIIATKTAKSVLLDTTKEIANAVFGSNYTPAALVA